MLKHLKATRATGDVVVDVANIVPVIETSMDGTVSPHKPYLPYFSFSYISYCKLRKC